MHSLLKTLVVLACAAAGIGLAVAVVHNSHLLPAAGIAAAPPQPPQQAPAQSSAAAEGVVAAAAPRAAEPAEAQAPDLEPPPPPARVAGPWRPQRQPEVLEPKVVAPNVAPNMAAPVPYQPPYGGWQGGVDQRMSQIDDTLRRLQDSSRRSEDAMLRLADELRDMNRLQLWQSRLAQLPVGPPAVLPTPLQDAPINPPAEPPQPRRAAPPELLFGDGADDLTLNVQGANIRDVLDLISQHADRNIIPLPGVEGQVSAFLTGVSLDEALQAVLKSTGLHARPEGNVIYVGSRDDFEAMESGSRVVQTRVYRPNYVSAAELQTMITPLLSSGVGTATVGESRLAVTSPAETGLPSDSEKVGGDSFAGGDALLVRDYENVLNQIDQVVAELDKRPRQVAIEAMILTVRLADDLDLGVNFELLRDQDHSRIVSGVPLNNLSLMPLAPGALKFGYLDGSLSMFIEALETIGETDIIASPRLMCLNKQRAEILIGAELGYVSTTVTQTAATQAVQFLEVGTQLRFRPFITDDDMVRLELHPELSNGTVRVEDGFTLPDKEVTKVTTNILCRNGATVIIGGLIREDLATDVSQIPVLGSLPWVGPAFRTKHQSMDRREIIVLITPRIVGEEQASLEGMQASQEYVDRHELYKDKMSPLARRHIATRYLRLAQAALNAGDISTAFRQSNLALHFDPENLEVVRLRQQILQLRPELDVPLTPRLRRGLNGWDYPLRNYPRRGVPWQPAPVVPAGAWPVYDDGQPGPIRQLIEG